MRAAHPQARVELWSRDEHRIGLTPILRRVWARARKGSTVKAPVGPRDQWMDVCAFVEPSSGRTSWLLLPGGNVEMFSQALALFAQEAGAGPDKHLVLILDGAGWHRSAHHRLPEGVPLRVLPAYSPEVQPAERLWPLANEVFTSLDEVEHVQAERCRWLQGHPEVVRTRTLFHWWPSFDGT